MSEFQCPTCAFRWEQLDGTLTSFCPESDCAEGVKAPVSIEYDGRICFGIHYYATEEEAALQAAWEKRMGSTYNGGWYDGRPCGREVRFDYVKDGVKRFAVTC